MRTQTQCNGIWQNSADGSIMYADTAHGVLWVRHVTDTTETWNTKHIAASNLRGYLAAMRENGWLMVSANADVVPNADAYNAWRADMFPHGIPRRVTDYEAAVYDRRLVACEEDAADGWTCQSPSCVSHPLTREAAAMVRMTMRGDCDNGADMEDDFDVPAPAADAQAATRTVESAPVLPAECSAETQEIPEVPPQTNENAHVLTVSEGVMITGKSVADLFPDVSYRTVRYFRRAVTKKDGTVALKKVAAVFKHGDTVHVLRRDRYIKAGRDQAVEAEIAAYVAKLRKAA